MEDGCTSHQTAAPPSGSTTLLSVSPLRELPPALLYAHPPPPSSGSVLTSSLVTPSTALSSRRKREEEHRGYITSNGADGKVVVGGWKKDSITERLAEMNTSQRELLPNTNHVNHQDGEGLATDPPSPSSSSAAIYGLAQTNTRASPTTTTTTTTDGAQRRILEHQYQHTLQELERHRQAYASSLAHAQELHLSQQQLRTEHNTLLHRYTALTERCTATEKSLSTVESALVQERQRSQQLHREREEERKAVSALKVEVDALQRRVRESTATEQRYRQERAESEAMVQDRSRFIPTMEVKRMREELLTQQRLTITQPLQQLLQALGLASDAAETQAVVSRSQVLTATRALDDELAHTEATVTALQDYWNSYHTQLEHDTMAFLDRVVEENSELYNQLAELQQAHSIAKAELDQRLPPGEAISMDQYHEELEQQSQLYGSRLAKAQELLKAQTMLIRQHEDAMESMLRMQEEEKVKYETLELEKASLSGTLEATKESERRVSEQAEALQNALNEERRVRSTQFVAVEEKVELEACIRQLEETARLEQVSSEALRQQLAHTQSLLDRTSQVAEQLEAELKSQQAAQTVYKERWAADISRLETEHKSAVDRIEENFTRRVQELESELKQVLETLDVKQAELEKRQVADEEREVERRSFEDRQRLLEEERAGLAAELEQMRQTQLQPLLAQKEALEDTMREVQRERDEAVGGSAALETALREEKEARGEEAAHWRETIQRLNAQWEAAEAGRAALQQQLGEALTRIKEMELEMDGDRVSGQDRATLLRENQRLQEALQAQMEEAARFHTTREEQRTYSVLQSELQTQVKELQSQLGCLPPLQEALRTLEAECQASKAEIQALLQERDGMAAHIKTLVRRQAEATRLDEELNKVLEDASEVTQRCLTAAGTRPSTRQAATAKTPTAGTAANERGASATQSRRPAPCLPSPTPGITSTVSPSSSAAAAVTNGAVSYQLSTAARAALLSSSSGGGGGGKTKPAEQNNANCSSASKTSGAACGIASPAEGSVTPSRGLLSNRSKDFNKDIMEDSGKTTGSTGVAAEEPESSSDCTAVSPPRRSWKA